jgi:hypothetical protein
MIQNVPQRAPAELQGCQNIKWPFILDLLWVLLPQTQHKLEADETKK